MVGWGEFAAAFAVFMLSHALPARPALRRPLTRLLGERGYLLAYSLVSLGILAWLIAAAGRAPFVLLWPFAAWQAWVPNLVMPVACLLAAHGVGAPNPLSFGGTARGFDPSKPGVAAVSRHPLLLAIALWAGAHVVANGDLAHLLLFGSFAAFAVLAMPALDRRKRLLLGEDEWRCLTAHTSAWPLAALINGRARVTLPDAWRFAAGVLLWIALLHLHEPVIGVSPFPPG